MKLEKLIGQVLDSKYRLDRLLGQGGMGAVFLATHLGTKRPVALKVIAPQFMANEEVGERFRREAEAAGRLRHPNVVNVTDFGVAAFEQEKLAYLVMEYLDGSSLGEMMKQRGQLPLAFVVDLTEQICLAIGNAHSQGIIHRDLKPDNILLEPDQRGGYNVKVLDFGLAKLRDTAADSIGKDVQSNDVETQTQAALNKTTQVVKTTQAQNQDGEAQTKAYSPAPSELESATLIQPSTATELEAATLISTPRSTAEIEAVTQIQPATISLEEPASTFHPDDETATRIQPSASPLAEGGEAITHIQFETDTQTSDERATRIQTSAPAQSDGTTAIWGTSYTDPDGTSSTVELTRVGSILGTPLYMSPEQCGGEALDPRSDIYSLGVIVYQMLAGDPPFSGSMTELMMKHADEEPPSLRAKRKNLSASVAAVVMSAMAKKPNERPATAEAFAGALRATAEGEADILRQTKTFYYSNKRFFFTLTVLIYAPCALITLASSIIFNPVLSKSPVWAAVYYSLFFLFVLFATRFTIAASARVIENHRQAPVSRLALKPILRTALARLPQLVTTTALAYLHILWGLIKLLVPGWKRAVDYSLLPPVVMIEGKRGRPALERSQSLVNPLRLTTTAFLACDFGICLLSLVAYPTMILLMVLIFGGTRGDAIKVMQSPEVRNFIAIYVWFLLIMIHTIYGVMPLAMLYFKARQAKGEEVKENVLQPAYATEPEKRTDRLSNAARVWLGLPLLMLAFLMLSSVINFGGDDTLIESVRKGRVERVRQMLEKGTNPDEKRIEGTTALMYAAQSGQIEILKALLAKGAKVGLRDDDGDDALMYAAMDGRTEAMRELLAGGADVNLRNKNGDTALIAAAARGRTGAVKVLLAAGVDTGIKNNDGKTALQRAEEEGHAETAKLLKDGEK